MIGDMLQILGLNKEHDFSTSWKRWREKVFAYARLEGARKGIKQLLDDLDKCQTEGIASLIVL